MPAQGSSRTQVGRGPESILLPGSFIWWIATPENWDSFLIFLFLLLSLVFVSHAEKNDQAPFVLHHSISPAHPSPLLLSLFRFSSYPVNITVPSCLNALRLHSLLPNPSSFASLWGIVLKSLPVKILSANLHLKHCFPRTDLKKYLFQSEERHSLKKILLSQFSHSQFY